MFKKAVILGVFAGVCAGIAAIAFAKVYNSTMGVDFTKVVKPIGLMASCLFGCLLAAIGYFFFTKWMKKSGEIVFNFVFVLLTFASIIGAFGATLPLDVQYPEMFPGEVIPMHFFPVLAWFTLKPIIFKQNI